MLHAKILGRVRKIETLGQDMNYRLIDFEPMFSSVGLDEKFEFGRKPNICTVRFLVQDPSFCLRRENGHYEN